MCPQVLPRFKGININLPLCCKRGFASVERGPAVTDKHILTATQPPRALVTAECLLTDTPSPHGTAPRSPCRVLAAAGGAPAVQYAAGPLQRAPGGRGLMPGTGFCCVELTPLRKASYFLTHS